MLLFQTKNDSPADTVVGAYVRPYRTRLLAGIGSAVAGGLMALAIPQALRLVVESVVARDASAAAVWGSAGVVAVLGVLQVFFQWLRRFFVLEPSNHIELDMRQALFDRLVRLPVSFHDRWPSGQLLSRSMSDLSLTRRWVAFGLVQSTNTVTTIVVGLGLMLWNSWQLALVYAIGVLPVLWILWRTLPDGRRLTRAVQQQAGDLATEVEESVRGIRVLKALGRGPFALAKFSVNSGRLRDTEVERARYFGRNWTGVWLLSEAVVVLCLGLGGWLAARGLASTGALVAFFATAVVVTNRIRDSGQLMNMYLSSVVARERHTDIMLLAGAEAVPVTGATHPALPARGASPAGAALELRGVGFSHEDSAAPVLADVDLALAPGETVALVGPTGSGKSTLLMLLPRLLEATSGRILLDGQDVADLELDRLRGQIAVAFEEPTLFSASVRENVLLGLPDAVDADGEPLEWEDLPDDERERRLEVLETALEVAAADFVADLPEGVETQIGEEGLSLSGGQRQRIALARAVAARPRLLLLDDPLSALDTRTEARVVENLRRHLGGSTVLLTAHRPSTVLLADRVALLEDGRVRAAGRHQDLLADPAYRHVMTAEDSRAQ